MLNKLFFITIIVSIVIFLYFFYLGKKSQSGTALGLDSNVLYPCPDKPNCVSSEAKTDSAHYIEPFSYQDLIHSEVERKKESQMVWQTLQITLKQHGAKIEFKSDSYLAATFRSGFFGFVDDFEARLDDANATLHFRSASRVGTSDLGVNRKRVKAIIDLLEKNRLKIKSIKS